MIDSSLKTYWHASWKVASDYPHWFILDMGKDVTVASVELTRRKVMPKVRKGKSFILVQMQMHWTKIIRIAGTGLTTVHSHSIRTKMLHNHLV